MTEPSSRKKRPKPNSDIPSNAAVESKARPSKRRIGPSGQVERESAGKPVPPAEVNNHALLSAGLDYISQGISVFDSELRLVASNARLFELLDFPLDLAALGTPFEAFMRHNAERGEYGPGDIEKQVRERVELAEKFSKHYIERTRPDGMVIAVQGTPLPHGGFVSVFTDITEQRKNEIELSGRSAVLEERVKERTAKLSAANKELRKMIEAQKKMESALVQAKKMEAVGRIAGGLSHDFNNLLTVILGNLEALRERYEDWEEIVDHLEPAIRAARRGADSTRQLLAFARRQPLQPVPVDVASLMADMVPLLRRSMGTIEIAVVSKTGDNLCCALADPHMLENALLNLAMNSRDAMPSGGLLSMEIERVRHDGRALFDAQVPQGDYVQISVRDTGLGIDKDIFPRVFEPFVTTKDAGSGTGLGLSLVYGFVKQSGGFIKIDSERGTGTCVTFLLPYSSTGVETTEPLVLSVSAGEVGEKLVLLVEDEEDVRSIIRHQLSEYGYMVVEARDARQAMHLIDTIQGIDILISDVMMPGPMNGLDLAKHARVARPAMRIVLISGYVEQMDRSSGDENDFPLLRKPFDKSELFKLIAGSA